MGLISFLKSFTLGCLRFILPGCKKRMKISHINLSKAREEEGDIEDAEREKLKSNKREMVCTIIIFIRKAANRSSSVDFLFLEFFKSAFETLVGGKILLKETLFKCLLPKKTHYHTKTHTLCVGSLCCWELSLPRGFFFTEDPSVLSSPVKPSLPESGLNTASLSEGGTGGHPWLSAEARLVWRSL